MRKTAREEEENGGAAAPTAGKRVSFSGGVRCRHRSLLLLPVATTAAAVVVVFARCRGTTALAVMVVVACKCCPQAHLASPLQLLVEMEARAGQLWILMAFSR